MKLCGGKKAYRSWRHASNDAEQIREKADNSRAEAYRCRECQAWHVGDTMVRDRRRPRAAPPGYDDE